MVSSFISIPPLKNTSLLSNSINLFLIPTTGCKIHPDPLPPVSEILFTDSISNFCGSTMISSTLPVITGWTRAVVPEEPSTLIKGGLTIS